MRKTCVVAVALGFMAACLVLLSACELSSVPAPKDPRPTAGPTPTMSAPPDSTMLPQRTATIVAQPRPRTDLERSSRVRWRFAEAGVVAGAAAVSDDLVYFSDQDGNLYALDTQNGQVRWQSSVVGSVIGAAVVAGSLVVVTANSLEIEGVRGGLVAVDASTGEGVWSYPIEGEALTSPAFSNGLLYFGGGSHLYAVEAATGKEKWRIELDAPVNVDPVIANGLVYTADNQGNFYAIDADRGRTKWKSGYRSNLLTSAAVAGGMVYLGSVGEGRVYALDAATGKEKWRFKDDPLANPPRIDPGYRADYLVTSPPRVAGEVVYVGISYGQIGGEAPDSTPYLYALAASSGKPTWQFVAESRIGTAPLVDGRAVYFASQHGLLHALDLRDGQELWRFEVDAPISASPVLLDDTLYFGTWADGFYALRATEVYALR